MVSHTLKHNFTSTLIQKKARGFFKSLWSVWPHCRKHITPLHIIPLRLHLLQGSPLLPLAPLLTSASPSSSLLWFLLCSKKGEFFLIDPELKYTCSRCTPSFWQGSRKLTFYLSTFYLRPELKKLHKLGHPLASPGGLVKIYYLCATQGFWFGRSRVDLWTCILKKLQVRPMLLILKPDFQNQWTNGFPSWLYIMESPGHV